MEIFDAKAYFDQGRRGFRHRASVDGLRQGRAEDGSARPGGFVRPAAKVDASGPLKVAFVYVSPANEEGWSSQHDKARQAVEKHFGDKIKVTWLENIPENADAERVIRDLATQGNKLIFATSFGYMNSLMKVAKEFPDVIFEHATGYKTDKNVTNYTARFYESRYLAGKLAGATTKTNILGYVAAFPIPEVLRGINAYTLGARSVNPNVEVRVVWTSSWYDPGKETDATKVSHRSEGRRDHASHEFDRRRRHLRRSEGSGHLLQFRHEEGRAHDAPGGRRAPLGRVLHEAHPDGPRRHLEQHADLGRRA